MRDILGVDRNYASLSTKDLLDARDQYHWHLVHRRNVIGTAVGLYHRLCGDRDHTFLLESADNGMWSRWSFVGVNAVDYSGYPDCRDDFVKALNQAVSLGLDRAIRFETPLMWLDKAETWALADHYGHLDTVRHQTLTCYNGVQGDGCGACPACELRRRGLDHYLADKSGIRARLYEKSGLGEKSGS